MELLSFIAQMLSGFAMLVLLAGLREWWQAAKKDRSQGDLTDKERLGCGCELFF